MLAILALHATLLPEAHWRGDEFICSAFARDGHLAYLWRQRIGGWSPRPLSESVFYVYCRLAAALQRPLTIPFIAMLWIALFASTLASMRTTAPPRLLAGLATCCMFLLGHPVGEMFYWPAGAVAYVSTLAAASLAVFLLIDDRGRCWSGTLALSATLAACAACSEAGACLTVLLAPALAALRWRHPGRALALSLPGLGVVGFVFWEVAGHRVGSAEAVGHLTVWQSLRPVPSDLWREARHLWPARLAFLLGMRWCTARTRPKAGALMACAVVLPLAAAAVAAASWHQFGALCCERHESLRQCWMVLALAAAGSASVRLWTVGDRTAAFGPGMLMLACLIGIVPRLQPILHDIRLMDTITMIRREDWRGGRAPTASMQYYLPPVAMVAGPDGIPTGHFTEPALESWSAHGMMLFFHKHRITILPPA